VRLRVVHCLPSCYHPVVAAAAFVELLLPMPTSTAVAAGSTGIATAGIARPLLIQAAGCSYPIASAVVVDDILVIGLVICQMLMSSLFLIHNWRKATH